MSEILENLSQETIEAMEALKETGAGTVEAMAGHVADFVIASRLPGEITKVQIILPKPNTDGKN